MQYTGYLAHSPPKQIYKHTSNNECLHAAGRRITPDAYEEDSGSEEISKQRLIDAIFRMEKRDRFLEWSIDEIIALLIQKTQVFHWIPWDSMEFH